MTRAEFLSRLDRILTESRARSATAREAAEASALRISQSRATTRQDVADAEQLRAQVARSRRAVLRPHAD